MENKMTIFENKEFGRIRTINDEKGGPLFCAKDVCDALGYNNSRDALRKHVEGDDVAKCDTIDALGRRQLTSFINESGLHSPVVEQEFGELKDYLSS